MVIESKWYNVCIYAFRIYQVIHSQSIKKCLPQIIFLTIIFIQQRLCRKNVNHWILHEYGFNKQTQTINNI